MAKTKIKVKPGQKPTLPIGGDAFVIGNGTSRQGKDLKPLMNEGIVLACNWFYRKEFRPHVLVCSDEPITETILKTDPWYPRGNWFYTWFPKPGSGAKKAPTPEKFAAGPMAAYIACNTYQSKNVFLIGMDFFGFGSVSKDKNGKLNNMYAGMKHYQTPDEGGGVAPTYRNWQRRFQWIIKSHPNTNFYHVNPFEGKSPERLIGLDNFHQISWEEMQDYLQKGAELPQPSVTAEERALAYDVNPDDIKACIERQLSGQENVLFPDMLSYETVLNIRLSSVNFRKQHPEGHPITKLFGFEIMLPDCGSSLKECRASTEAEYKTRYTTGGSVPPRAELLK